MGLLIYLHVVFNQKPVTCLSHLHEIWPRDGVLRVELFFQTPPEDYNLEQSYAKEYQNNYIFNRDENSVSSKTSDEVLNNVFSINFSILVSFIATSCGGNFHWFIEKSFIRRNLF